MTSEAENHGDVRIRARKAREMDGGFDVAAELDFGNRYGDPEKLTFQAGKNAMEYPGVRASQLSSA